MVVHKLVLIYLVVEVEQVVLVEFRLIRMAEKDFFHQSLEPQLNMVEVVEVEALTL